MMTFACRELPMTFFSRRTSSLALPLNARRGALPTALRAPRRASARGRPPRETRPCVRRPPAFPAGAATARRSVTGRMGASRRTRPSAIGVHRCLRRTALRRCRAERVEPILRDVGVERAEIDGRELVDRLEDRRIVVVRVGVDDRRRRRSVSRQGVAIDLLQLARAARDRSPDRSRRGSTRR